MTLYVQQGVVDNSGNVTLQFPAPGIGQTLTGTLTVVTSPNGVTWTVKSDGTPVTTIIGSSPLGDVQARDTEVLSISASNLVAGTEISATWAALSTPSASTPAVAPGAPTQAVISSGAARLAQTFPAAGLPAQNLAPGASTIFFVPLQPNERSLVLLPSCSNAAGSGSSLEISVYGLTSQTAYSQQTYQTLLPYTTAPNLTLPANTAPAYGLVDSEVTVQFFNAGSNTLSNLACQVLAVPDEVIVGNSLNPESVIVVSGGGPTTKSLAVPGVNGFSFFPAGVRTPLPLITNNGSTYMLINEIFGNLELEDSSSGSGSFQFKCANSGAVFNTSTLNWGSGTSPVNNQINLIGVGGYLAPGDTLELLAPATTGLATAATGSALTVVYTQ